MFRKAKNPYIRISYEDFLKSVDTISVQNSTATIEGESGSLEQYRDMIKDKNRTGSFPFNLDLSNLDTGSITNILNDIEQHLPLMESEGDLCQLLKVKAFSRMNSRSRTDCTDRPLYPRAPRHAVAQAEC